MYHYSSTTLRSDRRTTQEKSAPFAFVPSARQKSFLKTPNRMSHPPHILQGTKRQELSVSHRTNQASWYEYKYKPPTPQTAAAVKHIGTRAFLSEPNLRQAPSFGVIPPPHPLLNVILPRPKLIEQHIPRPTKLVNIIPPTSPKKSSRYPPA